MLSEECNFLHDFEVYSVTQQIADYIKENIIYGNIQVGEKLPSEAKMAEQLNVSRNTIRGAVNILANENLIVTKPGRSGGHYVSHITEEVIENDFGESLNMSLRLNGMSLDEVIEIRQILEVEAAYLAAIRRTEEDLKRLRTCLNDLNDKPFSDLLFCKNNYVFNRYIALATQNRLVDMGFTAISRIIVPLFKYICVPFPLRSTLNNELRDIYIAIKNQDADAAKTLMANHLRHFEDFFGNLYGKTF